MNRHSILRSSQSSLDFTIESIVTRFYDRVNRHSILRSIQSSIRREERERKRKRKKERKKERRKEGRKEARKEGRTSRQASGGNGYRGNGTATIILYPDFFGVGLKGLGYEINFKKEQF